MACKYIFNNITYSSKEEFVKEVLEKDFLNQPKTLRVQEIQQPDFLKNIRKDKDYLKSLDLSEQQESFLNLLFGDNEKWVKFFISSLIQNAAKNGYSKVWLPTGNTSAKVEGHTTLEEFKKQKEDRIKFLDGEINDPENIERRVEAAKQEKEQLKQELERVEKEGFGALRPIYNFYENTVANILKKQGYNLVLITDEYGNTWNEIKLTEKNKEKIFLNKSESKVNNSDKYFKDVIQPLIKTLSKKFPNTKVTIISENELPEKLKGKNINSYYKNNQVFIIKERVTPEITIEEFLHPFINVLKESNVDLYNSLLKEAKQLFPELRADIKDTYKGVYDNKDDIDKEFLTQVLSKKVSQKQLTLFEQFKNWLKEILFGKVDNINIENLDIDMKLGDVISLLSDNYTFNINDYSNKEYYSKSNDITDSLNFFENLTKQNGVKDDTFKENDWSEDLNTLVTQQFEHINTTFEQKRNVEKLMSMSSDLSGTTKKNYILKNNTVLERASTVIKKDERFKFDDDKFDESKYDDNKIWGNQIDDILRSVIQFRFDGDQTQNVLSTIEKLRNKRGEESQINEEITNKLIYEFNNFLKQNPNKVAIPQVFLYNEGERIGGTADLILVDEFGNSEIIDLKSSVNPTKFNGRYFEDYTKVGESGEEYTNRYDKAFQNDRGSKKEKHEAQLSMYAGMLESRAIPLKGTTIFPIHIAETVGDAVTKINVEKQFPLLLNATYLNKTNIDSKHNFRIANTYETEFDQNVNKVVLAVKNEIALLKHIKTENTTYSIKSLERMLKILENRDFVAASRLALYVTDLHKTFLTGDFNLQSKINGLVSEIKGGKITDNRDIIEKLLSYKKKVDHFRPLLNDLTEFYDEVGQDHKDPESIISKLGELSEALKHIDSQYKRTITPFIAENFAQFTDSEEFTKELEKKFDKKQKKIDEYQLELLDINKKTGGVGNNRSKKIEGYISNLKDDIKIGRRTLQTTKEDIINQLKNGMYEDISFAQTWAMAPQDAPNVFVAGASIIIDNNDNELRQHLMELQEEFLPVYKEYARTREGIRNNPKEFNDGLFEIITLGYFDPISKEFIERQELAYVQKTDITKFNKEKKEFQESIKDIEDRNEYWKKLNDWYSLNTKPISAQDEVINGVVIQQGYLSVIKDKMKDKENHLISEKQFNDWRMSAFKIDKYGNIVEVRNDTKEGKELREPNDKYINDKWLALQNGGDIAKLNFYNMLIAQAHKSRQLLPQQLSQEEKYILPYNNKVGLEKSQDGIKKFAKDKWDRAFNEVGSDVKMQYGETTESGLKVIPTMYTSKIAIEDVSLDLAQSTLLFAKEALQYEARVKLEPLMSALQIAIATNKPKKTDSKGRLVLKKFAEELNLPGLDAYVDSSESNIEAFFKYYIDHAIYGISREKSMVNVPILGETDLHSVVDTLSAVIANTSMGLPFGLFSNVANYLQGGAQNIIEANALQFTDKATLAWANKEYASFTDDFVKDVVDPIPETFIGQLIEIIDPFMGEFKDRFGRKISKSQARILMNSSPLMFLQSLGEHNVQLTMMLAMMKNTKLKDEQGLDTNLYDVYKNAWNPETKKIEIKSNILSQLGSTTSNGLLSNTFKNKLSYVLQSTHGNYSKMTAPMANKFWYSRVIKFMRNFFANAVAKRWRGERKNFRVMDITEGYNRTFYRLMREEFKEMVKVGFGFHTSKDGVFNSILGTDTSTLTPKELANLRRNAMDMAFILSTSLIMMLLTHMLKNAGDDDEKRRITMLLAPVMRLNAELSAFGQIGNPQKGFMLLPDVGDISRNLSNPTVMYGYIKKTVSFVEQIPKDITNLVVEGDVQRYEKATGYYEKGDSKLMAKFVKLFGASPSKMDLGESIKALNMQQNR